ncbi:hypothetical protein [Streptomyces canus]|uniref:hypothetical protein n=1 Tax=Streptomyces canus TaxID=58343 RepID=UPI00324BB423
MHGDARPARIRVLSGITVRKYGQLRRAVDLILAARAARGRRGRPDLTAPRPLPPSRSPVWGGIGRRTGQLGAGTSGRELHMHDTLTTATRPYAADSPLAHLLDMAQAVGQPTEDEQREDAVTAAAHYIYTASPDTLGRVRRASMPRTI